jgi:hypothetical protein
MPESRQLRLAKLEAQKTRCRRSLEALRLALTLPHAVQKNRISALIEQREAELRVVEDELHELYVEQIRAESSGRSG